MRTFSARADSLRAVRFTFLALAAFVLVAAMSIVSASPASAHAEWLGSSPEDGATVEVLPESLTLTFSSDLLAADGATEVVVTDESGTSVTVGSPVVEGPIVTQQLAADASAGLYRVIWKVVYEDGHPDSKEFSFTVTTGAAAETTEPAPTPTEAEAVISDAPTPAATPLTAAPADAGTAIVWVLLVLVVLALIALIAVITIRKRRSANAAGSTPDSAR